MKLSNRKLNKSVKEQPKNNACKKIYIFEFIEWKSFIIAIYIKNIQEK